MKPPFHAGWARCALPILLALSALSAQASCLLPVPVTKGLHIDQSFQHVTPSADGFFELHWNSSGDSALAEERVPRILAALQAARTHYLSLPGVWDLPLGARPRYPVLVVRQSVPGATTLPFSEGGVDGLTWIQLDHQPERWGGDPDTLLDVTCAHELFHALQFAQGADLRNLAFYEASAVWAEDQVFPDHDDWAARYLPALLEDLPQSLDHTGALREYGAGAVIKYLLAGEADWSACRAALREGALTGRCWPLLLDSLGADPHVELAGCLAELLRAGEEDPLRRVPELGTQAAPPRESFPELTPTGALPAEALTVESLGWRALPVSQDGELRVAGQGLFQLARSAREPAALADSSLLRVTNQDWLLVINESEALRAGLVWLEWLLPGPARFRIWPNPGDGLRQLEFSRQARPLEIRNLLGQRLGRWSPPGPGPGPWPLLLPPSANGPLLVWDPESGQGVLISVLR